MLTLTPFYRSICVGKDWKYCHVKQGRRWDANCAKSRQRHKERFPLCRNLFMKQWDMREMRRYPWQNKKEYEKRLHVKRQRRYRIRQNPEKQSKLAGEKFKIIPKII